jgi:hypothetical protein
LEPAKDRGAKKSNLQTSKVLFMGEAPAKAAPSLTLASALQEFGYETKFSEDAELSDPCRWEELLYWAEVVVVVDYTGPGTLRLRQLAWAGLLGKTIVRWWVGSDVLHLFEQARWQTGAKTLDRFTAVNIAVAPHLVKELADIGIQSRYVPSIVLMNGATSDIGKNPLPQAVLIYLPENRLEFYGAQVCEKIIKTNSDIQFKIVGDDTHSLAGYENVESFGWVDMQSVWPEVGALLRITRHDGMPRMVLEALAMGKYVIYAWEFPGCWVAQSEAEIQERLDAFRRISGPNRQGIESVQRILQNDPAHAFAEELTVNRKRRRLRTRTSAMLVYLKLSILVMVWKAKDMKANAL